MANRCDPLRLSISVVESFPLDPAVMEIDPDNSKTEKLGNVRAELAIIVAIAALEVHGHRHVNRRRDPFNDLLGKRQRKVLAILLSLRYSARPTAGRNRLRAGIDERFRLYGIPRIVKYHRRPCYVKVGEVFGFPGLVHCHPPVHRLHDGEIADRFGVDAVFAHAAGDLDPPRSLERRVKYQLPRAIERHRLSIDRSQGDTLPLQPCQPLSTDRNVPLTSGRSAAGPCWAPG